MLMPLLRRLLAVAVAVLAAPSLARADVQILVEELNAAGTVLASQFTTGTVPATGGVVMYNFTNGQAFGGGGTVTVVGSNNSFNPSFSGFLTGTASPTDRTLRITVTNDAFSVGPGFTGTLLNDSGATSAGLTNGSTTVTTFSRVYNPAGGVPASSTTQLATGTTLAGPTDPSTTSGNGSGPRTTASVASLPTPFAIQQTLLITINSVNGVASGSFGATGGAQVAATPIPAPAGVVLALAALPLLGLRRRLARAAA